MADEQKEMSVQERVQALNILGVIQSSLKVVFSTNSSTVRNADFDEIAQISGFSHPNDIAWLWTRKSDICHQISYIFPSFPILITINNRTPIRLFRRHLIPIIRTEPIIEPHLSPCLVNAPTTALSHICSFVIITIIRSTHTNSDLSLHCHKPSRESPQDARGNSNQTQSHQGTPCIPNLLSSCIAKM
eukprot:275442_1